ncbi:ATP-binding protein [Mycolicibacterium vanbaalenii]|uniref:ATP-binding protein n=1 Tax=Mycolicibacterium vanbaalenii TaxID=110539 RepID=UPI003CC7ED9D
MLVFPQLRGDAGGVLGNLLENALRHTPPGGSVELGCVRDGDRLTIAVADNGEGIAAECITRVFERSTAPTPPATASTAALGRTGRKPTAR